MGDKRWDVEVRPGVFEDVGADALHVTEGGALVFHRLGDPSPLVAYAPSAWVTVSAHEEGVAL